MPSRDRTAGKGGLLHSLGGGGPPGPTQEMEPAQPYPEKNSELIISNLPGGNSKVGEHFNTGFDHHRRTAEVVFDGLGIGVGLQVILEDDLMDKSGEAAPLIFG